MASMLSSLKTPRGEPRTERSISPGLGSLRVFGVMPMDSLWLLTCINNEGMSDTGHFG